MSEEHDLEMLLREAGAPAPEGARVLAEVRQRLFGLGQPADVGRYERLRVVGRGGMGVVYRAWDPALRRDVALKLVRSSQPADRERLLREARTAAIVDHPNVVRIFDVGRSGDDVFIAMELVDGFDLDAWLESEPRSVAEITEVLLQVGRGLEAAHEAGVVHLDIKPRNILVGHDGRCRVADFGLARAPSLAGSPVSVGGTPRYQPPRLFAVSRAVDQYGFAVTAWESLCRYGGRPRPPVPTGEPLPASVPASTAGALQLATNPDPEKRLRSLGELLGAMSQPSRSFGRAAWLAVGSFLAVLALGVCWPGPPGTPLPTASPRGELSMRMTDARQALRSSSNAASRSELEDIYLTAVERPDPEAALASAIALASLADQLVDSSETDRWIGQARSWQSRVRDGDTSLVDLEVLEARLARKRGRILEARAFAQRAWALCGENPEHAAAVSVLVELGEVATEQARRADALEAFEAALQAAARVHPERRDIRAAVLLGLGNTFWFQDDLERAAEAYQASLDLYMDLYGPEHERVATATMNVGLTHRAQGRYQTARTYLSEALDIMEQVAGSDSPDTALALMNLGTVEADMGRWDASASHHRRAVVVFQAAFGPDHPRVAMAMTNLGAALADGGRLGDAVEVYGSAVEVLRTVHEGDHPAIGTALHNLAVAHRRAADIVASETLEREALRIFEAVGGREHRDTIAPMIGLAFDTGQRGAWDESTAFATRALSIEPRNSLLRALAHIRLGKALAQQSTGLPDAEFLRAEQLLESLGDSADGARTELAEARASWAASPGRVR